MSLRRRYRSAAEAERLAAALVADHPQDLQWRVRGPWLEFKFAASTAESARATADDLLACLSAAERTGDVTSRRRSGPGRSPPAGR